MLVSNFCSTFAAYQGAVAPALGTVAIADLNVTI